MDHENINCQSAADNCTLNAIHEFAQKHKDNPKAAEVLMSFCRGECLHFYVGVSQVCDLCGYDDD